MENKQIPEVEWIFNVLDTVEKRSGLCPRVHLAFDDFSSSYPTQKCAIKAEKDIFERLNIGEFRTNGKFMGRGIRIYKHGAVNIGRF